MSAVNWTSNSMCRIPSSTADASDCSVFSGNSMALPRCAMISGRFVPGVMFTGSDVGAPWCARCSAPRSRQTPPRRAVGLNPRKGEDDAAERSRRLRPSAGALCLQARRESRGLWPGTRREKTRRGFAPAGDSVVRDGTATTCSRDFQIRRSPTWADEYLPLFAGAWFLTFAAFRPPGHTADATRTKLASEKKPRRCGVRHSSVRHVLLFSELLPGALHPWLLRPVCSMYWIFPPRRPPAGSLPNPRVIVRFVTYHTRTLEEKQ